MNLRSIFGRTIEPLVPEKKVVINVPQEALAFYEFLHDLDKLPQHLQKELLGGRYIHELRKELYAVGIDYLIPSEPGISEHRYVFVGEDPQLKDFRKMVPLMIYEKIKEGGILQELYQVFLNQLEEEGISRVRLEDRNISLLESTKNKYTTEVVKRGTLLSSAEAPANLLIPAKEEVRNNA